MTSVRVFVAGVPAPQGSKKGYPVNGHVRIVDASAKTRPWRALVSAQVGYEVGDQIPFPDGPVKVVLEFRMPRRAAEPKRVTPAHTRKPDIDKLTRCILDALKGLAYGDDSQVVDLHVTKTTSEIGEKPGCRIWAVRP